ncbi:MAG TPA: hypothetical protein VFY40_19390 [Blastocatellia bacterium]|nr:hypothetical protein [Blastocatellia bacterium]
MKRYHTSGEGRQALPAWEKHLNRALLAALAGRDYRRHIARARAYARLEEREEIDRAVEAARETRRKAARV